MSLLIKCIAIVSRSTNQPIRQNKIMKPVTVRLLNQITPMTTQWFN